MTSKIKFMRMQPRLIRLRDAPGYLGMDVSRFNVEVRPQLIEVPIGDRSIAFDREELDEWADNYIAQFGRMTKRELLQWQNKKYQGSSSAMVPGISTNVTSMPPLDAFDAAVAQVTAKKPSSI